MARYVADTHAQVIVPTISLAELVILVEKGRIGIGVATVVEALRSVPGFEIRPLTPEVALSIQSLTMLADIHDRLITAEAIAANAALITQDQAIRASGLVSTIW